MKTLPAGRFVKVLVLLALVLTPFNLSPAQAAATQADVDYSTQVSALAQEFAANVIAWSSATANPPTLAFGSKYNAYKTKALKTSDAVLATALKFKALTPSEGFPVSGPLLLKAATAFETAVKGLKTAISKNDAKQMKKSNALILSATSLYSKWGAAYADEVKALNG
jgi:hypothetical protein